MRFDFFSVVEDEIEVDDFVDAEDFVDADEADFPVEEMKSSPVVIDGQISNESYEAAYEEEPEEDRMNLVFDICKTKTLDVL